MGGPIAGEGLGERGVNKTALLAKVIRLGHLCILHMSSFNLVLVTTFPRVVQRYGTIAVHSRRRATVLLEFVMFWVLMNSFAGLIRRISRQTFSETAITDRHHSDTTIFSAQSTLVFSIGKFVLTCTAGESPNFDLLRKRRTA